MGEAPKILLGVTGSIAAFKAAALASALVRRGASLRVVMTDAAARFVGPLTFQALSGHPVYRDMFDGTPGSRWDMAHLSLAEWPDLILVCPASADIIARVAGARADDLLSAVILATSRPLVFAPAMNPGMWRNTILREKVASLEKHGARFIGPAEGRVACGDSGAGRMVEPEEILDWLAAHSFLPRDGKQR